MLYLIFRDLSNVRGSVGKLRVAFFCVFEILLLTVAVAADDELVSVMAYSPPASVWNFL